jgi:uncharacterized membrane protein
MEMMARRTLQLPLKLLFAAALAAGMATAAQAVIQPRSARVLRYMVVDLGTLPECDTTYAQAVNNAGWVAGYAYKHVPPGHGDSSGSRPFLWREGKLTELRKLGSEHGQALTINAQGDVGGYAETKDYADRPVVWRRAKEYLPEQLSTEPGSVTELLNDGSAAGSIVSRRARRVALWAGGRTQVLGNAGDVENEANGLNRAGAVVGFFIPAGGAYQSMMSPGDRHAAMWTGGRQIALPELGGKWSECRAVNEGGVAVGWSDTPSGRRACAWMAGQVKPLATTAKFNSEAYAINRAGTIIGQTTEQASKDGWKWLACIWRNGKQQDLNQLIPAGSGWKLSVASGISDNGFIVGYGSYARYPTHHWRAFLLRPVR